MSRTEILFQMTQIIRSRDRTTAKYLADRLNISIRTVYRYINDLSLSGVPVISQAGKGYWIDDSFNMPPVQLSEEELLALSLGSRLVKAIADPFLADASQQLLDKVEAVIPKNAQHLLYQSQLHAPKPIIEKSVLADIGRIRKSIESRNKIQIMYLDQAGNDSTRTIWPLALAFWGQVWTVAAWCEHRQDFRAFRVDRIQQMDRLPATYPVESGKSLADFIANQAFMR
jgi:predicted DNA-binding transcriptional regulator YafY